MRLMGLGTHNDHYNGIPYSVGDTIWYYRPHYSNIPRMGIVLETSTSDGDNDQGVPRLILLGLEKKNIGLSYEYTREYPHQRVWNVDGKCGCGECNL